MNLLLISESRTTDSRHRTWVIFLAFYPYPILFLNAPMKLGYLYRCIPDFKAEWVITFRILTRRF
jgi:hypothetical protein